MFSLSEFDKLNFRVYICRVDSLRDDVRALLKNEDGVRGALISNRVYDPLLFSPGFIKFTSRQYLFLRHYRLGVPIEDAALKADMTVEQAERFLSKPDTIRWLEDRAIKDHIKLEWSEPSKWWAEGEKVWSGQKEVSRQQMDVWKEFGSRISPVSRETNTPKIEIHIDPESVKRAFERQSAIEAQLVKESNG